MKQRYAFWECSVCKQENSGKDEVCSKCFSNQEPNTEFYEKQSVYD